MVNPNMFKRWIAERKDELNVVALTHGADKYIWIFTDEHRNTVLRLLGSYAADARLNFSWMDAARLAERVRSMVP